MDNEYVKKLTGKDRNDYEFAAAHIINNCDSKAFDSLVEKSDFLFDFIKENVKKRLTNVITNYNYKNLLCFLKTYSFDYEELIISTLVKYADEDLTDEMLEKLENGTEDEKAYCAKYFAHINDPLSIEFLKKYSYSDFDPLAMNCAEALSVMKEEDSFSNALKKLKSEDEFEKLSAVKFLVAYKDERALLEIFEAMKKSPMAENIASEIPYLKNLLQLLDSEFKEDALFALNHLINGFGEIISLSQVFDFELFEVFNKLIESQMNQNDSKIATFLLTAKEKFNQLTENDEYIFDESKEVKSEIHELKNFLNSQPQEFWESQKGQFLSELTDNSDFVFSALELAQEFNLTEAVDKLKNLLTSSNQTIILKTVEVLKSMNKLQEINKDEVLNKITDENIRLIIESNFD